MSQLKIGIILSYVIIAVSNISGLLYTPYMLNTLGQAEYGLYSLVASVVSYLTVLDLGFGSAIVKYASEYKISKSYDRSKEYQMYGMFMTLYLIIGGIAFIIGYYLCNNVEMFFGQSLTPSELDKARIMMLLLVGNIALTFPLSIYGSIITVYEQFFFLKMINLVKVIINPLAIICMLFWGYKAISLVIVATSLNLMTLFSNFLYCKFKLKIKIAFGHFDFDKLREILKFSLQVFVLAILDKFYYQFATLMLGGISGTLSVAVFALALQFRGYLAMFSGAINGVFLPRMVALSKNNRDEISDYFIQVSRLQFYIVFLVLSGFIIFGKTFILLWAGENYVNSYYVACIIMLPFSIALIQNLYYPLSQALNKQKSFIYIYTAMIAILMILARVLIPIYDVWGAAMALSITTFIGEVVLKNIVFSRQLELNIRAYWVQISRMIMTIGIVSLIGFIFFQQMEEIGWIQLLLFVTLYTLIYFIVSFIFLFNKYERSLFFSITKYLYKNKKDIIYNA